MNSMYSVLTAVWVEFVTLTMSGTSISLLNPSRPAILKFINQTHTERHGQIPSDHYANTISSLTQISFDIGGVFGCILSHFTIKWFSRRSNLLISQMLWLISAVLMSAIGVLMLSYEVLIAGRIISGIARGVSFSAVPLYISEIVTHDTQGFYQSLQVYFFHFGITIGALVGQPWLLGSYENLIILFAFPAIFPILFLISFPWIPRAPASIIIKADQKKDKSEVEYLLEHEPASIKALRKLRKLSTNDFALMEEHKIIQKQIEDDSSIRKATICEILSTRHYLWQLVIAIIVAASCHFSLCTSFDFYSEDVFTKVGLDHMISSYVSLGIFVAACFSLPILVFLIAKFGIKKVYIASGGVVIINHIILTIFSNLILPLSKWICIVSGFLIIVAGNTSFAAVNVIATQITTFVTRPMVFLVCSISFYASATMVTMVGADMLQYFGSFAFIPWSVLFLFSVLFVWKYVPDTHKQTVDQIQTTLKK